MKPAVRIWIDELKHTAVARKLGRCKYCSEKPILGREKSEDDDRALHWCQGCKRPAYGDGRSYVANVALRVLMNLPIVIEIGPVQGSLL